MEDHSEHSLLQLKPLTNFPMKDISSFFGTGEPKNKIINNHGKKKGGKKKASGIRDTGHSKTMIRDQETSELDSSLIEFQSPKAKRNGTSQQSSDIKEISYLDFLNSPEVQRENLEKDSLAKNKGSKHECVPELSSENKKEDSGLSKLYRYPDDKQSVSSKMETSHEPKSNSITKFFIKSDEKFVLHKNEDSNRITIHAQIHDEPRKEMIMSSKDEDQLSPKLNRKVKSNVAIDASLVDLTITCLDEIQVPAIAVRQSPRKHGNNTRVMCTSPKPNRQTIKRKLGDDLNDVDAQQKPVKRKLLEDDTANLSPKNSSSFDKMLISKQEKVNANHDGKETNPPDGTNNDLTKIKSCRDSPTTSIMSLMCNNLTNKYSANGNDLENKKKGNTTHVSSKVRKKPTMQKKVSKVQSKEPNHFECSENDHTTIKRTRPRIARAAEHPNEHVDNSSNSSLESSKRRGIEKFTCIKEDKSPLAPKAVLPAKESSPEGIQLRRSSRRSAATATIAINETYQKISLSPNTNTTTPVDQHGASKSAPLSEHGTSNSTKLVKTKVEDTKLKHKSSPKKGTKLAPIFCRGKKKCTDSSNDSDIQIMDVQIDPSVQAARRAFLLSSVPTTLRRQQAASKTSTSCDYPPFPLISHVQQMPKSLNYSTASLLWNVQNNIACSSIEAIDLKHVDLKLKRGILTNTNENLKTSLELKKLNEPSVDFGEDELKYLLAEVHRHNPLFPVRKVYRQLERRSKSIDIFEKDKPKGQAGSTEDVLWTEKYSPMQSSEILGNSGACKRLRTWLNEWKDQTDLEIKRLKKMLKKQAQGNNKIKEEITRKLGSDWWADDDSDFDLSSDAENSDKDEEAQLQLGNIMLLTGPSGVGKTAMVYALANELGYKVFEINASSRRTGKQMISQLQEATQSHQVGTGNLSAVLSTVIAEKQVKDKKEESEKKIISGGFANFFSKAKPVEKTEVKPAKGKRKKELVSTKDDGLTKKKLSCKSETPEKKTHIKSVKNINQVKLDDMNASSLLNEHGLNLSSTSLILFEEVDVVFEEDKAFWHAIQTFQKTTKRPIILTASDAKVAQFLDRTPETLVLRRQSIINLASYLGLICISERVRVDFNSLLTLVEFTSSDLRQLLNVVQFWIKSGANPFPAYNEPMKYLTNFINGKTNETPSKMDFSHLKASCPASPIPDSSDEFQDSPIRPRRKTYVSRRLINSSEDSPLDASPVRLKRNRRNLILDEDSNSQPLSPQMANSQDSLQASDSQNSLPYHNPYNGPSNDELGIAPLVQVPPLHSINCLNLCNAHRSNISMLQDVQLLNQCEGCQKSLIHLHEKGHNLVYSNLPMLLQLPKCVYQPPPLIRHRKGIQLKSSRIKSNRDLFDSDDDSSGSEFLTLPRKEVANKEENDESSPKENKEKDKIGDQLCLEALSHLSNVYDALSFIDSQFRCLENSEPCPNRSQVKPGLDDGARVDGNTEFIYEQTQAMKSFIITSSLQLTNKGLEKVTQLKENLDDRFKLAVVDGHLESNQVLLNAESRQNLSMKQCSNRTIQHLEHCLPLVNHSSSRSVALDYLPTLRGICRFEQLRQATNTRRRFLHYFDGNSLGITRKQAVLDQLCSAFI